MDKVIPKIYDKATDELRDVTQADVDMLTLVEQSLGLHRQILKGIVGCKPISADGIKRMLAIEAGCKETVIDG